MYSIGICISWEGAGEGGINYVNVARSHLMLDGPWGHICGRTMSAIRAFHDHEYKMNGPFKVLVNHI